jgi:hypothetical protein
VSGPGAKLRGDAFSVGLHGLKLGPRFGRHLQQAVQVGAVRRRRGSNSLAVLRLEPPLRRKECYYRLLVGGE